MELEDYTKEQLTILSWCAELAGSQGFYGRLYEYLRSDDGYDYLCELADQDFGDAVDFCLYVEC